jgi:hypothetical protein
MPENSCAPEFEIVGWLLAQIIRNDAHGRTRIIRKNNLEKRMLAPSPSLSFSDAAPHPLVNRLSNDYREYMYLFLGCQQSILVHHLGVSFRAESLLPVVRARRSSATPASPSNFKAHPGAHQ